MFPKKKSLKTMNKRRSTEQIKFEKIKYKLWLKKFVEIGKVRQKGVLSKKNIWNGKLQINEGIFERENIALKKGTKSAFKKKIIPVKENFQNKRCLDLLFWKFSCFPENIFHVASSNEKIPLNDFES